MSATKDTQEVPKKPSSEAKRIIQNDQEKQRKEKIKTCIGEIAKELPPSADHVDRKPSTLSIVSQAKDYIKSLKEKNQAYEKNFSVAEQEELKRLREIHAAQQEKIKQLEETVKAYALDKVLKNKSVDDTNSTAGSEGRQGRPKTIKLLEKERNEQLQTANTDFNALDASLPLVGSTFNHHSNNSGGGTTNSSLPPSSLVLPVASSGISIMTVAPTILSVKSPSLGQTRNQQTSRSISTSSVAGSTASSRVNPTSSSLAPYMDIIGNDYGTGNVRVDGSQANLVYSTSSISLPSSSILSSASGNIISTTDLMGLQQQHQGAVTVNSNGPNTAGVAGGLQTTDFSLLHHQQQGISPMMNLHQDGSCSTSALQTLASVATSSHMAGLTMAANQNVGATTSMMGLPMGLSSVSVGQLHQQQAPIMTDTATASAQGCKQVFFNGQVLTLSDQGLSCGQQQHSDADCQSNLQTGALCQQSVLPLSASTNFQHHQHAGINAANLLNQGNFNQNTALNTGSVASANANQSVIYTFNDQGQLVPLHSSMNQIQPATATGLDFVSVSTAGGTILSGFQNSSAGGNTLIPSSIQHQAQTNFLTQTPIVSLAGQASNQPFTILPPSHANPLSNQIIPAAPLFMTHPMNQQNQVLNLAGLSGLQMVNPFSNMLVNNMTSALNGATVKLVGNELKIIQPGESPATQGPTHVMVDGSLIPISTNPQTIVPAAAAPLNTIAHKQQQLSLGGNSILQFDPNNPNAPPILISGPVTTFQMAPQIIGAGPLHSPAMSAQHGILQMASAGAAGGSLGSNVPFQLGGTGGLAVASSMVASTVTTNSVTACISSPSVTAASKGAKGLPPLAPALSQTSPTIGSTVAMNSGYQTMLTSGVPQQFIINGQKIVTKLTGSALAQNTKSAQNRKRSPSASRASPIAATDLTQHFNQQQHLATSTAAALVAPIQTSKNSSANDKSSKSKSSKANRQQSQLQQQEEKTVNHLMKTDLLAQATATAGILMDAEGSAVDFVSTNGANESTLNISAGSNMNLSGSSVELQINLKHSPRDEEDDNVQLIIDENCMSGISSTSPAHSSFSPNMSLGSALSVNTSSSVFTHELGLGGSSSHHQSMHLQPSSGDLTTPLVSPNITSSALTSKQNNKLITSSPITGLPTPQQLSPLSFTPVTSSAAVGNPSTTPDMQLLAGSLRPEDVFARFSGDSKLKLSPDIGNKLNPFVTSGSGSSSTNTVFDVGSNMSLSVPTTSSSQSPAVKAYIPIAPAPAPAKAPPGLAFLQDSSQSMSFLEAMNHASLATSKSKSRSKKVATPVLPSVPVSQVSHPDNSGPITDIQADSKKKAAGKKRKTKAELRQEKEEKERAAREEEAERKGKGTDVFEKSCAPNEVKHATNVLDDDSLIPVLNENDTVKEQILNSVSESKLLNTDGSQISLMDMVDKIEIFNSGVSDADDVFPMSAQTGMLDTEPVACDSLGKDDGAEKQDSKATKRESSRKRKVDNQTLTMVPPSGQKTDNKRPKKPTKVDVTKQMGSGEVLMFGLGNNVPVSVSTSSSDIYAFVDEEDSNMSLSFLQQPPTPVARSPTKKNSNRKNKNSKNSVSDPLSMTSPLMLDTKTSNSMSTANVSHSVIMTRSETKNSLNKSNTNRQTLQPSGLSCKPVLAVTTSSSPTVTAASAVSVTPSLSPPSSLLMPKSPPLFSSMQNKSQVSMSAPLPPATTSSSSAVSSVPKTQSTLTPLASSSSFMSKKMGQVADTSVQTSLEESFSIEFPVMDFHSSPKLTEAHDDHDNSIGLPAETIADFFNQQSPGKMMLNASPPNLQNGVLSPSDVDLPALRTPATPMNHNHTDPVLMLDSQANKEMVIPSPSNKQPQSRMHTPPPLDPKSPANTIASNMSISSSTPGPSLSLPQSSSTSSPLPPALTSSKNSSSGGQSSCMNSGNTLHHLDTSSSATSNRPESPMPSLSSSSLDALSEIIPLKPITSELETEENESCVQQQRRPTPVLTQPLTHVPLNTDIGMGLPPSAMPELQQKSQSQRPNPPHLPPQSSPHNLRPPSASTTPLPSPKLHTSPGSASSVHSMSPAAQQHGHSCQKQQQQSSQMGSGALMDRVSVPPLSHPPQQQQQAQSLSQLFPDTSPCSANFASPPSGSSMKLKHMSPSNAQEQQNQNFMNSQKTGSFSQNTGQQQKNQYSVDKIIEHPNNNSTASSRLVESFNFTNIGSNVTTAAPVLPTGSMPLPSSNSNGFSFSLSPTSSQPSSCSGNLNASNSNNSNRGSLSSMQTSITHNSSYLSPFFPPAAPMNIPASSASSSSTHHSLGMHPLGNMEIQHTTTSRPSSGGSAAPTYGLGPSSLMTYDNHPKLDIPPIVKSPTYNTSTAPTSSTGSSNSSNKSSNNGGSGTGNYGNNSKQAVDSSSSNRYPGSKSTPESIYQQQQKRPNTIQHPPSSHMEPMSHLSSSAHNNSFFPMGFPPAASASMPLRHLPDTRDMTSRSPYEYPSVSHHPAMGFPHPHSQITSGYNSHTSFTRDCARLDTSHHQQQQPTQQQPQQSQQQQQAQQQQQQTQQQQPQQSQQSPRKQSAPKKSSSSSSVGGTSSNSSASNSSGTSNSSNRSASNNSGSGGSSINQGHSPASSSSSRTQSSQHHSNHQQNSTSTSNNSSSSSHNRTSGNSQKRKSASSSSSSSKKKNTASQHTGFPSDTMDASMSQNMFETTFNYLNFPTLAQSMSPPAARPHQADTPFLGGMFNPPPRPISNSGAKTADMAASQFSFFHTRAQNSFFQPGGFGMNSMTSNHGNAPHSMGVPPHMSFGLFGNETASATDNITSNKFLHSNPILPGAPHQSMDHSLQHGAHQTAASLYHSRPHSAQSHVMAAFYPHSFDSRGHMGQPFNSSMGPPTFHTPGLPPINFSMHDSH